MHCAKHGLFRDGIIAHHAKRIRRRVRANHFVMLVNYDGCQRQHGKQRVGGIIQCVIIGIMLIIVVAVRQRTPPRTQRFNHGFILAYSYGSYVHDTTARS